MLTNLFAARQTTPGKTYTPSVIYPRRSIAGIAVTEEQALSYSPVFSAVKVISETVGMLPWRVFRVEDEVRKLQSDSSLDRVLHRVPNTEMSAFNFREYLISCALLWGNGYAEIQRNGAGQVVGLWPIHPSQIEIKRDGLGHLLYKYSPEDGGESIGLSTRHMFHLRGPTTDGVCGRSIISLARESIGLGIASEQFGAAFFGNGGVPGLVITETGDSGIEKLSQQAAQNLIRSFERRHRGSANAGRPHFLEKGFEVKPVGIPQKDAQFIESRKFQVTEVARWFRLPPHKIGDMEKATYSNIEQQAIDFVTDSIQPWTERLEQEADIKLHGHNNVITKIDLKGLLRGDSAARGELYNKLWNMGVYSINDIRRLEDMNPVEGGDQRFVPLNMVSLEQANRAGRTDDPGMVRGVLIDAHERMQTKELNALNRAIDSKKDIPEWSAGFYSRHRSHMVEALLPGARAAADICGLDDDCIVGLVESHVDRYVEASLVYVASEDWDSMKTRSPAAADKLLGRIAGASL